MGVKRLTKLLSDEGWMPKVTSCREESSSTRRNVSLEHITTSGGDQRIERIPQGSTLVMDGNGLAFHLHEMAYAQHFDNVTRRTQSSTSSSFAMAKDRTSSKAAATCSTKPLNEQQATALLPTLLPLDLLESTTKQFATALQQSGMNLEIYWDGSARRLKSKTTRHRSEARNTQWDALKQYCQHGVIPSPSSASSRGKSLSYRDFLDNFPFNTLFLDQIRHSLADCGVPMISCTEEADAELARRSAEDHYTYCVGNDSDFCLFHNCKYIPFDSLDVNNDTSLVMAVVITPTKLVDHFDLPDEEALVEFAILMGNDYIDSSMHLIGDLGISDTITDKLDHIRSAGAGYRISSSVPEAQTAINFTRDLYGLRDLSKYPFDTANTATENTDAKADNPTTQTTEHRRPRVPPELDLSLGKLQRLDFSLRDVVLRPLHAYCDLMDNRTDSNDSTAPPPVIRIEHLEAFQEAVSYEQSTFLVNEQQSSACSRPLWEDIEAAYVIEKCISWILRSDPDSPFVRRSPPSKLFDQLRFHSLVRTYRIEHGISHGSHHEHEMGESASNAPIVLPIDEHEEAILEMVKLQRVSIIHGETGCGKSSRVPAMILRAPPPDPSFSDVKLFISQPRRIAAKSLVERVRSCEPDLKDSIALRMGHGVREYESHRTRAWFVTTGYLVRLLANHPEKFDDVTHLIIDEVHERSVDTDILCLLCKRLLQSNSRIRLILMSATLAASLYQQYFRVPQPPLKVGARRFPIQEYYIEDLIDKFALPTKQKAAAVAVKKFCESSRCGSAPPRNYMEQLYVLASHMTMVVGRPGSSVLIFVPGMSDIISITDLIEKLYVPGIAYTTYPIHSDIPFDEQLAAFDTPALDEVKVVIATNAAESSVTLPDVDHVICFGLCNQIVYNSSSHRQMLVPCWISRASATQRAGRTGRVREGNVYRLYPTKAAEEYMEPFEPGEMQRIPLDSVILSLKEMLKEEAKPVLLQCIEPPDISAIDRSFKSLFSSKFINEPDDHGDITSLGSFVIALGIDLALGSLIGLGIQFGVAAEAIEMAAVLSFPKTPWIMTNPLYHDALEYNETTKLTFISRCHFDARVYSEPLAAMNLLFDYDKAPNKQKFCWHFGASSQRLRRLSATKHNLRKRVADFLSIDAELLQMDKPPVRMHHAKLTILRVLQVWVFSDSLIECPATRCKAKGNSSGTNFVELSLTGLPAEESHFKQILDIERHPFTLTSWREIEQLGSFIPFGIEEHSFEYENFLDEFEKRFVSFALESKYGLFLYQTNEKLNVFVPSVIAESEDFKSIYEQRFQPMDCTAELLTFERSRSNRGRGRNTRASGLWSFSEEKTTLNGIEEQEVVAIVKFSTNNVTNERALKRLGVDIHAIDKALCCMLRSKRKKKSNISFSLISCGDCSEITKSDISDIFATPNIPVRVRQSSQNLQTIRFPELPSTPLEDCQYNVSIKSTSDADEDSSWHRPLMDDIPEGARLLSVLASGRRKDHVIRLSSIALSDSDGEQKAQIDADDAEEELFDVSLSKADTKISQRWRRFGTDLAVFISENSVPAAAVPMKVPHELFACCANTLELRGGAVKVEGVTLLPPGRLFLLLSLLTFGLQPFSATLECEDKIEEDVDPFITECLVWLQKGYDRLRELNIDQQNMPMFTENDKDEALMHIKQARKFHEACQSLGEQLVCQVELIPLFCEVFNFVDGYPMVPWDDLNDHPLAATNIAKSKKTRRNNVRLEQRPLETENHSRDKHEEKPEHKRGNTSTEKGSNEGERTVIHTNLPKVVLMETALENSYARLFCTRLAKGECVEKGELPTTNIMNLLLQHHYKYRGNNATHEAQLSDGKNAKNPWSAELWNVYRVVQKECCWYFADYRRYLSQNSFLQRVMKNETSWKNSKLRRPLNANDALNCLPPDFRDIEIMEAQVMLFGTRQNVLLFSSVDSSLRMEAAFWLELHFGEFNRFWYEQDFKELACKATSF